MSDASKIFIFWTGNRKLQPYCIYSVPWSDTTSGTKEFEASTQTKPTFISIFIAVSGYFYTTIRIQNLLTNQLYKHADSRDACDRLYLQHSKYSTYLVTISLFVQLILWPFLESKIVSTGCAQYTFLCMEPWNRELVMHHKLVENIRMQDCCAN